MVQQILQGAIVQNVNLGSSGNYQGNAGGTPIALYFDIVQEHSINLQSQITDNWLENNTYVNDFIANSPLVIDLKGLSGELVYVPSTTDGALMYINDTLSNKIGTSNINKLSALSALYPPVDNLTQLAKNAVTYIEASYNRYKTIIDRFKSPTIKQQKLRKIYQDLSALRASKSALMVQTPFGTFDSMYIQSLILRQSNQNYIVDIELSLKELNFLETQNTTITEENLAKCNLLPREEVEYHGYVQGKPELSSNNSVDNIFKLYISND